ncbi:sigma factor-like helix-turn-helix DNA-binding protein [Ferviditalea candida]|uniref:Sigma factor-like helix-turn-helix DNA-binding protein n=1 Tax=Ferviditalea candida TaxID=3108399 RepID=A0ABU5ZFL1_9BACL|nr:sigma factor-like helix-turn-helix DNA-binding protein [Paenibacillaceae bacterium T2]
MHKEHLISQTQKLNPNYRIILEMRWKQELTYKEIADEPGTTEDIIRQKLNRARKNLTAYLMRYLRTRLKKPRKCRFLILILFGNRCKTDWNANERNI